MTLRLRSIDEIIAETLATDPLKDFFSWWDQTTQDDLLLLKRAIDSAKREEDIQQFLQKNPAFLIQHLGGGHGRWVIPKQRLGTQFVTDFLIAEKNSYGFQWQAVELESPLKPMFNKNGDPSQHLNHALRQLTDWRAWLKSNQSYASRPRREDGLGLTDIDTNIRGLILISRGANTDPRTSARRRQMIQDLNVQIHSYDYLISSLEGRLLSLARNNKVWKTLE